jgi:ABC-type multidrug transport system fused ATPase/permease subunit
MNEFIRILKYLRPHLLTFVLATVAMILVALFETATMALLVPILTRLTIPAPELKVRRFSICRNLFPRTIGIKRG